MTLARFTPSVLDGATLEQLFVHRHHLLDDVLTRVTEATTGTGRRHRLFVGQRGAGKTHLISLVHHRARQAQADGLPIVLSWLMEDPWEIETYDDLLAQILEQAGEPAPPRGGAEQALLALAADRLIVVLVENLDQILAEIGADGQRRLRALLENERPMLLVATSTRLSDDLLSQAEPFYGFFDTTQLEPFTVDQAADMLTEVAHHADDDALASLLATPTGRARLATIAHLAGGQPRVWALLGTGLTDSGIDDMVDMLLARFDDLTPYYQEQLARLSPSERKVVRRIADADRPMTVGDVAEAARLDQRSVSKTISDLRKRGWVRKHESILTRGSDARLSYYELAEPLARIAFQMKAARGEPVRLVVDFLSTWFDAEELDISATARTGDPYRVAARMSSAEGLLARALSGERFSVVRRPELSSVLRSLDDAVAEYARTGSGAAVLAFPVAVSQLIEQQLIAMPVLDLRLELARLAVVNGGDDAVWIERLEDLGIDGPPLHRSTSLAWLLAAQASNPDSARFDALLAELDRQVVDLDKADLESFGVALAEVLLFALRYPATAGAALRLASMNAVGAFDDLRRVDVFESWAAALWQLGRNDEALQLVAGVRTEMVSKYGFESAEAEQATANVGTVSFLVDRHEAAVEIFEGLVARALAAGVDSADPMVLLYRYCAERSRAYFDPDRARWGLDAVIADSTGIAGPSLQRMIKGLDGRLSPQPG